MRCLRAFATTLIALGLSGCAGGPPWINPGPVQSGQGAIVLSMAHTPTAHGEFNFDYRRAGGGAAGIIRWYPDNAFYGHVDFKAPPADAEVLVWPVDPGDYEWIGYRAGVPNVMSSGPNNPPPVPFSIRAGEVTYLGDYLFDLVMGRNIFGLRVPGYFYVVISDESMRDLETARRKHPEISGFSVTSQIPAAERLGHPLYRTTLMTPEAKAAVSR